MDRFERWEDPQEANQQAQEGNQASLWTSLPATIISFDPQLMTASVQPTIQGYQRNPDGTSSTPTMKPIDDVPVEFPTGGGFTLTFPIKPGDECTLAFQSRCIDHWWVRGGVQPQADLRMHHLGDAIARVGVRSQPRALNPPPSTETTQLRSDDGTTFVEIQNGGVVRVVAPTSVIMETPNLFVTGNVTAGYQTGDQVDLQQHTHSQPPDSGGDGESETDPPTPGT